MVNVRADLFFSSEPPCGPHYRASGLVVRPRWRLISTVGVRVGVSHSSVAEGNCIRREAGWGATGGEVSVRRMTNSIRRDVTASPPAKGRSLKLTGHAGVAAKAMAGGITWLEVERPEGEAQEVGRPGKRGDVTQKSEPS